MKNIIRVIRFIANHPLSKYGLFSGFFKFLSWQILIRLGLIKTVNISKLAYFKAIKGVVNSSGVYYVKLMEYNEMRVLLQYLNSDDTFIDVGANIGTYSILLSIYSGCNSHSFEPDLKNFQLFVENIKLNKLENQVFAYNMAVSDFCGKIGFTSGKDAISHIDENSKEFVNSIKLDDFFLTNNFSSSVIKIDVEGYENLVISGFEKILRNEARPEIILIELRGHGENYGYSEKIIFDKLVDFGYKSVEVDFNNLNTLSIRNSYIKGDHIFIKNSQLFLERLNSGTLKFNLNFS
jgi:FkbM family methyltransferase